MNGLGGLVFSPIFLLISTKNCLKSSSVSPVMLPLKGVNFSFVPRRRRRLFRRFFASSKRRPAICRFLFSIRIRNAFRSSPPTIPAGPSPPEGGAGGVTVVDVAIEFVGFGEFKPYDCSANNLQKKKLSSHSCFA